MTLRKRILGGIGALAFMTMLAVNVQLVQSPKTEPGILNLTLLDLAASAQGEGGGGGGGGSTGTCCPTTSGAICFVGSNYVIDHYYLSEGDCPPLPPPNA